MIETRECNCGALAKVWPYSVFIPDEAAPPGGWPVLLVLHGAGRNHRTVIDAPELRADIERRRLVIVFPNGAVSFYLAHYQSMLAELLALAGATLPVDRRRAGICGWSMGGFGAVRFAEDFPEQIVAVGSLIGLLDYPNPALPAEQNYGFPPVVGTDPAHWQAVNCMTNAARLRGRPVGIMTAHGAFDYRMNVNFHERLEALGIAHRYEVMKGAHDWPTVARGLPRLLDFMATVLDARSGLATGIP